MTQSKNWWADIDTSALPPVFKNIEHYAQTDPEMTVCLFNEQALSYEELWQQVEATAKALLALGIQPGQRVATLCTPRPEFLVTYLAASSIGAVWLGLNPRYTVHELSHVIGDAEPALVFTLVGDSAPELLQRLEAVYEGLGAEKKPPVVALNQCDDAVSNVEGIIPWTAFIEEAGRCDAAVLQQARDSVAPSDTAMIVYTSGTTGKPKGARIRHSGLSRLAHVQSLKWGVKQPRVLVNLPINHIGCVGDLCTVTLYSKGSLVFSENFNVEENLALIENKKVSALFQIPTQLQMLAASPNFNTYSLASLALVGWGGGPLSLAVIDKYRAKGCRVMTTYGLTEVGSSVSYTPIDASEEVLTNTVGSPDPQLHLRFLAEDGSWAGEQGPGEVCVKHPSVMAGYLNLPEATAEAFTADGWLRTGDIGELRDDGNLVLFSRVSEMYKSGGYNVYPREIEQVLESYPGIEIAVVVSRPDPQWGEVGAAFLEAVTDIDVEQLQQHARNSLANYKIPKAFSVMTLPRLSNDKIDKQKLREIARKQNK
ncbi:acyl--CoA ligase [Marinobacter sp. 1-3A]|uniref:class I adenylate-forming enzyme family protein n=1 Tax=Marinobacter sp. 1-3A TaxID=2582920 RepID=UPI0019089742|nr:class I adenylate-forming enzyme family protein [Marinobacter sp. 1-3A]MBK1874992.1 acyl--CoA ligase [Marinobacter sp. 1-3A]